MIIKSQYSKSFVSDNLNGEKYALLLAHAHKTRDLKNEISSIISKDLNRYLEMSKFGTIKLFENKYSGKLPSADLKCLITDVYNCYQSKFEAIIRKVEFEYVTEVKFFFYQRNTKKNKKGDLKSIESITKSTPLSKALTYLARHGFPGTIDYIKNKFPEAPKKQQNIYQNVLDQCEKFGFDRLYRLAMQKRQYVVNNYSIPVVFESLTFRGNNRINDDIVDFNENFNSPIDAYITLGNIEGRRKLHIPVKYSKEYHGSMKLYSKGLNSAYKVCFTDNKNEVRIILAHEGKREIPDNKKNYLGVDVNIKHNMFSTEDRRTIDYDRKLLNRYADELLCLDELEKDKTYVPGKRRQRILASLKRKVDGDCQRKAVELVKTTKADGFNHLVMENINGRFEKSFIKNEETNLKYNRLIREVKLSSHKDRVEKLARKYGVSVSLIQSHYTSQECPNCHHVDKENRPSQEEFKCVNCGFIDNADFVSPVNIGNRVRSDVLRSVLLKDKYGISGIYEPLPLKKEFIKSTLMSCGISDVSKHHKEHGTTCFR